MQFFKIKGTITNENWAEENDNTSQQRKNIRRIASMSREFNSNLQKQTDAFLFTTDATGVIMTVCLILKNMANVQNLITKYIEAIGLNVEDLSIEEITLSSMVDMLKDADRGGYIDDDNDILWHFELENLSSRYGRVIEYGETILEERDKEQIYRNAKKYQMKDDLLPELDRIYKGTSRKKFAGHPVHYLIQTDDKKTRTSVSRLLLQALYSKQRIQSKRYCYIDIKSREEISEYDLECLYKSCNEGAIIARYVAEESTDDEFASGEFETVINLCEVMKRYGNQVLTILCLPIESTKIREFVYENLGSVSMVEIKEIPATYIRAKEYLQMLADEQGIRTDKKLFEMLEEDRTYIGTEMRSMFDEWYNKKLKTSIYPEYREIETVKKKAVKAKPKGTAYDELMEMIGLEEPKQVIKQALDFFKAQKLFSDKGMNGKRPSMHMVFTGNPGTAKTTVARLFARIMRENGLLSKGHLVEVGRGDLVGKYVGWTAPMVQKKFKEAKGGVLFIDEAYSLATERSGSYGEEAINTIVQEMENHRDELVVIFAGYPDEMEKFIQSNPGLRSRIAFHVPFSDYDTEELCQIARLQASKLALRLTDDAVEKMAEVFELVLNDKDFGNGRYVRNLIEKARMAQATRLVSCDAENLSRKEIATITAEDIEIPKSAKPEKATIGFRCA